MSNWIVAHSHANAEITAEGHLQRQGFDVYLPRYQKSRRHARRVDLVIRPLFPRYLFISYNPDTTAWRSIRSTVGISHLLTAGEHPLTAPNWVIEELRMRENKQGFVTGLGTDGMKPGQQVRIISGPFSDQLGIFDGLSDSQRVAVLLDVMGRQVRAKIPVNSIRATG